MFSPGCCGCILGAYPPTNPPPTHLARMLVCLRVHICNVRMNVCREWRQTDLESLFVLGSLSCFHEREWRG